MLSKVYTYICCNLSCLSYL